MKKKLLTSIAILFVGVFALAMVGCGGAGLSMNMDPDGVTCSISCDKADKDDFVMGGTLYVEKGQGLLIDQAFDRGSIEVKFISSAGLDELGKDASAEELSEAIEPNDASLKVTLEGTNEETYEIAPGSYYVNIVVLDKKTTGIANITVE